MRYFRLKNFETFQHYKDRNPPWIKLHRALLDDYEFTRLPDHSKAHLMLIGLLASQLGGRIPDDPKFVAEKIGARKLPDLGSLSEAGWLIPEPSSEPGAVQPPDSTHDPSVEQSASEPLADRKQDASKVLALARSREERTSTTEAEESRGGRAKVNGHDLTATLPNEKHRELAKRFGLDCAYQWEKYLDHEWKKGKKPTDDNRGFRNWVRKAHEFAVQDGKSGNASRPLDWGKVV